MPEHGYIMDSPLEGQRIERKTRLRLTLEQLRMVGVLPGMRVLDLGCASGTTTRLLAEIVGESGVAVGIDASAERIDDAVSHPARDATEYRIGDAAALPADNDEFDLAWSRFLFEYLPDKRAALLEMSRVVKPGGVVAVSDLDGNCVWHDPIDPQLQDYLARAASTFGARFDAHAGRKLYGLMASTALEELRTDIRPYHVIAGEASSEEMQLWEQKIQTAAASLRSAGWDAHAAQEFQRLLLDHLVDPRTFTYSVLITVWGVRPAAAYA